jgi:membrane fusion protein (multidrug efflux system)
LLVEEGHRVDSGSVLLRLEDDIQKNQFEKAKSNLDKARREFERSQALHQQNLISEQAFSDVQYELRQRELAFEDARRELEFTQVRAPIAGTVTRRLVKAGDLVNVNQHLFDLVDFNSIVARIYIPERELRQLAENQSVRVNSTALPGRAHQGYIQRIAPIVESKTGTVKVTVAFKDVGDLRPGMYVDTEIVTATRTNALLLSKRALVYDVDQIFAFRVSSNRIATRVLVEPVIADRAYVEPAQGFGEGDPAVVAGQTGLKDGSRVRLPGDPDAMLKPARTNTTSPTPGPDQGKG